MTLMVPAAWRDWSLETDPEQTRAAVCTALSRNVAGEALILLPHSEHGVEEEEEEEEVLHLTSLAGVFDEHKWHLLFHML